MTIPQTIMDEADLLRNTVLWTSNASIEVIAKALLAAEQRGAERERERAALAMDEAARQSRQMSKDAVKFNKFERRDFESMSIAYVRAAAAIRNTKD